MNTISKKGWADQITTLLRLGKPSPELRLDSPEEQLHARQVIVVVIQADDHPRGSADDVSSGHESHPAWVGPLVGFLVEESRIGAVVAIVAHHEVLPRRHGDGWRGRWIGSRI